MLIEPSFKSGVWRHAMRLRQPAIFGLSELKRGAAIPMEMGWATTTSSMVEPKAEK